MNRIKAFISNFILSKIDIAKIKFIFGKTPFLSVIYKIGSQFLVDYKFPTHIFIETTRLCNLKCRDCPRNLSSNDIGNMDIKLFMKIIDESTKAGSRNFCLHMFGEPLLSPQIVEMVKYIKNSNKTHVVLLTTNGYLLDKDKAKGLIDNGIDKIVVSFFSLKKDRLSELTGNNNIEIVITNIKNIVKLNTAAGNRAKIFIRFLMTELTRDELLDFRRLAKDIGIALEVRMTHNYSGVIKDNYTSRCATPFKRYPCYHLWFSPAISWDGKMLLCCSDWNNFEVLGDINTQTVGAVWQSEKVRGFRRLHFAGKFDQIELCKKCNVWTVYPDIFFGWQKNNEKMGRH